MLHWTYLDLLLMNNQLERCFQFHTAGKIETLQIFGAIIATEDFQFKNPGK